MLRTYHRPVFENFLRIKKMAPTVESPHLVSEVPPYHNDDDSTMEQGEDDLEIEFYLIWGDLRYGPGALRHTAGFSASARSNVM